MKIPEKLVIAFVFAPIVIWTGACEQEMNPEDKTIRFVRELSNKAIAAHDTATMLLTLTADYHVITSRNAESTSARAMAERLMMDMKANPT